MPLHSFFHRTIALCLLATTSIAPVLAAPGASLHMAPHPKRSPSPGGTPTPSVGSDSCLDHPGGLPPVCTGLLSLPPYSAAYSGGEVNTPASRTPTRTPTPSAGSDSCDNHPGGLPPFCSGLISLPPYSAAYSDESTPTPTPTPFVPICINQADPDNAIPDSCYCSQGSLTTTVSPMHTGNPCPWTKLPITDAKPAPSWTPPPQTNHNEDFSTTIGYNIYACRTSVVSRYDNVDVTSCSGSSSVVGYIPHATAQIGSSTVNVGTMNSDALFTAVSSALESACPTPPAGGSTGCNGAATITGVYYPYNTTSQIEYYKRTIETGIPEARQIDSGIPSVQSVEKRIIRDVYQPLPPPDKNLARRGYAEEMTELWSSDITMRDHPHPGPIEDLTVIMTDGELIIQALDSNYTTTAIRDAMISLMAHVMSQSASGKSCSTFPNWKLNNNVRRQLDPNGSTLLCSSTEFVQVEYMNEQIYVNNPAAYLGVKLSFQQGMAEYLTELFDCEEFVNFIFGILIDLVPELAEVDITAEDLIDIACLDSVENQMAGS